MIHALPGLSAGVPIGGSELFIAFWTTLCIDGPEIRNIILEGSEGLSPGFITTVIHVVTIVIPFIGRTTKSP